MEETKDGEGRRTSIRPENFRLNPLLTESFIRRQNRLEKQKKKQMPLRAKIMMGPLAKYKYYSKH